jgi:hypothetical protein
MSTYIRTNRTLGETTNSWLVYNSRIILVGIHFPPVLALLPRIFGFAANKTMTNNRIIVKQHPALHALTQCT